MTSWKISFSFALVTIACSGSGFLTSCLAHPSVDNGNQESTKDLFSSKYLVNAGNKVYYVETSLAVRKLVLHQEEKERIYFKNKFIFS